MQQHDQTTRSFSTVGGRVDYFFEHRNHDHSRRKNNWSYKIQFSSSTSSILLPRSAGPRLVGQISLSEQFLPHMAASLTLTVNVSLPWCPRKVEIFHDDDHHGNAKVASRTSLPHLDLELSVTLVAVTVVWFWSATRLLAIVIVTVTDSFLTYSSYGSSASSACQESTGKAVSYSADTYRMHSPASCAVHPTAVSSITQDFVYI